MNLELSSLRKLPRRVLAHAPIGVICLAAVVTLSGCSGCNSTSGGFQPADTGTEDTRTGADTSVSDDTSVADADGDVEADAPEDDAGMVSDDAIVTSGLVLRIGAEGVEPAEGVNVRAAIDLNGDGMATEEESCSALTNTDGRFELECKAEPGRRVVLSFREPGSAEVYRTFEAWPGTGTDWHVTLQELSGLACEGDKCALDSGDLTVDGVPEGLVGQGRVFSTLVDPRTLPGDSVDRSGNILLTGVIGVVEWVDAEGAKVEQLQTSVELRLRLPRETWSRVSDVSPDNDQIDVPLYAFDRNNGRWFRSGQGVLVDAGGAVIDESALSTLRAENLDREVFVVADIERSGYWSVQYPVETKGCVQGVLADGEGPVAGALIRVLGLTYDSRSAPSVTDQNGSFCVQTLRSEMAGEDLDRDGLPGEAHQLALQATINGDVFDLGTHEVLTDESACGEGACLSLGQIDIGPERVLAPDVCTVAGLVTDRFGQPVRGVQVSAWSQAELSDEAWAELCGVRLEECSLVAQTDGNGLFLMVTPRVGALTMLATITEELATRSRRLWGGVVLSECPGTGMTINMELEQGYEIITFDVTATDDTIDWSPSTPAVQLHVTDADGAPKWSIRNGAGIEPSVEYGVVPSGAEVLFPENGDDPEPLASGDNISISTNTTPEGGYTIIGEGTVEID